MGEIIARAVPEAPLAFTGERLTSLYGGQTEIEHLHRYLLAREWCRGKDVLDVASGEGYGTWMLAQVARSATGVELAHDAVEHATRSYRADNLHFLQGDARDIPLKDASLDVVVSFETIEHFAEQPRFVAEVRRVLRPDGTFIVSTPDRDNYSPAESPANPYHVQELTRSEFERLLQARFANVEIIAQRPIFGSVILSSEGAAAPPLCYERRGAKHFEGSSGLSRPQYYVAFASDAPLIGVAASVYIDTGRLGMQSPAEAEARVLRAEQAIEAQRAQNEVAEKAEMERHVAHLADERRRHEQEKESLIADERRRHEQEKESLIADERRRHEQEKESLIADERRRHEQELESLRTELAATRGEIKGLIASNEMAERAVIALRSELAKAEAEKLARVAAENELRGEIKRLIASHEMFERAAITLAGQREAELETCRVRVVSAEAALRLVHASTSWRLTRPLRVASRKLLRRP